MKQGMTIEELAREITARADRKEDFIADTRDLVMTDDVKLTMAAGEPLDVLGLAHDQIGEYTGIPARYYDKMKADAPNLLAANVNEWFRRKADRRMVRTLDGRARAFLSDRYSRMDDDAFAEVVLRVIAGTPGANIVSAGMGDERTHIKFVSERKMRDVAVNDPVQFGIAFSNSEVGKGRLSGRLLMYRLRCLNGMISEEDMFGANHVGQRIGGRDLGEIFKLDTVTMDAKATLMKLRDFATEILSDQRIDAVVERVKGLTRDPIKEPVKAVERLAKSHGFNEGEKESVLAHLTRGGDLTMWGLLNAVTASAQDEGLSYKRATELEAVGGRLLTLSRADYRELAAAA